MHTRHLRVNSLDLPGLRNRVGAAVTSRHQRSSADGGRQPARHLHADGRWQREGRNWRWRTCSAPVPQRCAFPAPRRMLLNSRS